MTLARPKIRRSMSLFDSLVAGALPWVPRSLVWRVARRYIAGLDIDAAVRVVRDLAAGGLHATLDVLGEGVRRPEDADAACHAYRAVLDRIASEALPSGVSIKLSQLGLALDPSLARKNVETVVEHAERAGRFVRIDMEDSSTTDATLAIYRDLRARHSKLGIVLQACLRRSEADVRALLPLAPDVRVCKGIYVEPASVAFHDPDEIRRKFLALVQLLLEGRARVAIATHDPVIVEESLRLTDRLGFGPETHEFQMLLGVGEQLRATLLSRRQKVRIYVPFGVHWYPYSLRRLRENPRIAGYVIRDLFRRK